MKKSCIFKFFLILFFMIIFLILTIRTPLFNRIWRRISNVTFYDGSSVVVNEFHSDSSAIGLPEIWSFQYGHDILDTYKWIKNGKQYIRKTYFIPIIINEYQGVTYTVEFDRETDFPRCFFRLYKYKNDEWEEINYSEFPKTIAVQNKWLDEKDIEILKKMDPEDYWFRQSLTGRLWILLETGKQDYESAHNDIFPHSLFAEFKEKYIIKKEKTETKPSSQDPKHQTSDLVKSTE